MSQPKDFTRLNQIFKALQANNKGEDINFLNGFVILDENDRPMPVTIPEIKEVVDYFFEPTHSIDPLFACVNFWKVYKGEDIPLPPSAKLAAFDIKLEGTVFSFDSKFMSDEGEHRLDFKITGIGIAQRMDVCRRISSIHVQLKEVNKLWNSDFGLLFTMPGKVSYYPLHQDAVHE